MTQKQIKHWITFISLVVSGEIAHAEAFAEDWLLHTSPADGSDIYV